jgi:uncharacterized protein
MIGKLRAALALPVIALLTVSCARDYREVINAPEEKFYQGQELEAAKMLIPQIKRAGKDRLLLMMEAGYLLHMAGKHEDSNQVFGMAAKIAEVIPISITQEAAALVTDQTITNYRGEDFEKVLIHMFLGINYLSLGNPEDAAVEFKAVNNELQKIKTEKGEARYKQNIMAKYLTAIAHELRADTTGNEDDREYAEVEYRQILELKPGLSMARSDLQQLQRSKKTDAAGELVVIFQAGRCPIKVSRGRLLDEPGMNMAVGTALAASTLTAGVTSGAVMSAIGLAENPIPKFKIRSNRVRCLRVTVLDRVAETEVLENVEYTAIKNLDDDYGQLRGEVAASIVTKAILSLAAQIGAQETTRKLSDGNSALSSLVGLLAGAGTSIGLFATMKPDLRCWHTLPANLQLARIRLAPGKYTATVQYMGFNGAVQETKFLNFEIKRKDKYFVNIRTVE